MNRSIVRRIAVFLAVIFILLVLFPSCTGLLKLFGLISDDPPEVPQGITAEVLSSTEVLIKWLHDNVGVASYEIERKKGVGNYDVVGIVNAPANSFLDEDVEPATSYTYRVRAAGEGGDSDVSEEVEVFTLLSNEMPAFDFGSVDIVRNAGSLGDETVEWLFRGVDYAVDVKVAKGDGTDTDWELFERNPENEVLCAVNISSFSDGDNEVFFRFAFPETGQTGEVGSLVIHKGPLDLGYPD